MKRKLKRIIFKIILFSLILLTLWLLIKIDIEDKPLKLGTVKPMDYTYTPKEPKQKNNIP